MYAKEDNDIETVQKIEKWFEIIEESFKELFDEPNLKLTFYRKLLNFKIEYDDKSIGLNG